jgi:hypothetical protein
MFDKQWWPLLQELVNQTEIKIDSGGDAQFNGQVIGQYFAKVEYKNNSLKLFDMARPESELACQTLQQQGEQAMLIDSADKNNLATLLSNLKQHER